MAAAGDAGRRADPPDVRHAETLERLRAGGDGLDLPRAAVPVRAHPAAGHRGGAARRAGRAPRRAPVAAAALRRAVGRAAAADRAGAGAARPRTPPTGRSGTRCWPRSDGTRGSCSARWRPGDRRHRRAPRRRPAATATRCWAGCRRDLRANTRRRPRGAPVAGRRRPVACRCTPATARPARSTCSARCCVGLLEDDPTLEPRDILVMCPDIEAYAPLIPAGFGLGRPGRRRSGHPGAPAAGPAGRPGAEPAPTRCSPSPPGCSTSPAAGSPPPRCSTWPAAEPVRRRFGFTDDDLDQLGDWVRPGRRSGGGSTPGTGAVRARRLAAEHLASPGSTGSCSGSTMAGDEHLARRRRAARSTTWPAATSTWPAGSPSTSTGCARFVDAARPATHDRAVGRRARRAGSTQLTAVPVPTDAWQRRSSTGSWRDRDRGRGRRRLAGRHAAAAGRRPRACWRTGSAGGRRGRTSAPAR